MASTIQRISGPVVLADEMRGAQMYEVVMVGADELIGEIIGLNEDLATIQVYEDTTGITPGEPVKRSKMPLSVELGPGLLGRIFDGIQRPLTALADISGDFIVRGIRTSAISRDRVFQFTPAVSVGDQLKGGAVIGSVPETDHITHRIMLPSSFPGRWRRLQVRASIMSMRRSSPSGMDLAGMLRSPCSSTGRSGCHDRLKINCLQRDRSSRDNG